MIDIENEGGNFLTQVYVENGCKNDVCVSVHYKARWIFTYNTHNKKQH